MDTFTPAPFTLATVAEAQAALAPMHRVYGEENTYMAVEGFVSILTQELTTDAGAHNAVLQVQHRLMFLFGNAHAAARVTRSIFRRLGRPDLAENLGV